MQLKGNVLDEHQLLEGLMEATLDAVVIVDASRRIVRVNRRTEELFGYLSNDLIGRPLESLVPERLRPGLDGAGHFFDSAQPGPMGPDRDFFGQRADGSEFPAEISLGKFSQGDETMVIATLRDISDQVVMAQQAADREDRFRTTLDVLEEGVVQFDVDGKSLSVRVVNSAGLSLLGVGADELDSILTTSECGAMDVDGKPLASEEWPIPTAIRTRQPVKGAIVGIKRGRNGVMWLRINVIPTFDQSGAITAVVASASDVTDLVAASASQSTLKDHFQALVEHSSALLAISDAGRRLRFASPAFERLLGRHMAAHLGQSTSELIHPDDRDRVATIFAGIKDRPNESVTFECRLLHADGSTRHIVITQTNRLDDPAIEGFVSNAHDITDRVHNEVHLEHRATHDVLTGLPNRSHFTDRLALAIDRSERSGEPFCLYFLDLDGFKAVNDQFGHDVGDQVLTQVAARLREKARPADEVARLGGDEFVLLAEGVTDDFAPTIRKRLEGTLDDPFEIDGKSISLQASVGFAVSTAGTNMQEILTAADRNMYSSKDIQNQD